jgi:predicted lipoprotein with Yx(FWY)xxD motif
MKSMRGYAALALASALISAPCWAANSALPSGVQIRKAADELLLADAHGQVLYRLDIDRYRSRRKDAAELIAARCAGVCDRLWRPVTAPPNFKSDGPWAVANHAGAPAQLTFKGDPLYTFAGKSLDEAKEAAVVPSYLSGYAGKPSNLHDGVPAGTTYWHAVTYQPPAPDVATPSGVSLRWGKASYVFADPAGKGLYTPAAGSDCARGCQGMRPLAAPLVALPVGVWRPIDDKDGAHVWSYRGRVVYQAADAEPKDGAGWQRLEVP